MLFYNYFLISFTSSSFLSRSTLWSSIYSSPTSSTFLKEVRLSYSFKVLYTFCSSIFLFSGSLYFSSGIFSFGFDWPQPIFKLWSLSMTHKKNSQSIYLRSRLYWRVCKKDSCEKNFFQWILSKMMISNILQL